MLGPHPEPLGHVGDHVGLADGLAERDRQGVVRIGDVRIGVGHEVLPWHLVHGFEHRRIGDAVPAEIKQEFHAANPIVAPYHFIQGP